MVDAVVIVQMSDPHITAPGVKVGRVDTASMLGAAVQHVNVLNPSLVLLTGDLVNEGLSEEYAHLRKLLADLRAPLEVLPGNHDSRDGLREAFELPPGPLWRVVDVGLVRLVLLDDVIPGSPNGRLGDVQLAWLDSMLFESAGRPVIVAVHHAPFATGIEHMDAMGLEDADAFGPVVGRHPSVERVICGHLHRPIAVRWHGTVAMTAPSVAHQVALDLEPDQPGRYIFEPPAVLLHRWTPETGLVTHVSYIGAFDGPYPFSA